MSCGTWCRFCWTKKSNERALLKFGIISTMQYEERNHASSDGSNAKHECRGEVLGSQRVVARHCSGQLGVRPAMARRLQLGALKLKGFDI